MTAGSRACVERARRRAGSLLKRADPAHSSRLCCKHRSSLWEGLQPRPNEATHLQHRRSPIAESGLKPLPQGPIRSHKHFAATKRMGPMGHIDSAAPGYRADPAHSSRLLRKHRNPLWEGFSPDPRGAPDRLGRVAECPTNVFQPRPVSKAGNGTRSLRCHLPTADMPAPSAPRSRALTRARLRGRQHQPQ